MKFKTLPLLPLLLVLVVLIIPETAAAQGFLPCDGSPTDPCNSCDIVIVANRLIDWLIGAIMVLFSVLLVIAGFGLVTSGGNPSAVTDAKNKFTNAFIGLVIVLSAWILVDTIMRGLVGSDGMVWSEIECTTQAQTSVVPGTFESQQNERESLAGNSCTSPTLSIEELRALGCTVNVCERSCLFSCMDLRTGSDGVTYCASQPTVTPGATGPLSGSVTEVPEAQMSSLRSAGVNVASWQGIDGPDRTDLAHPEVVAAIVWMQQEGQRRFGSTPFQVTSAYTRGVGHSSNSQHYTGRAVDIQPVSGSSVTLSQLNQLARDAGFTFVLTESRHVHMDAR